MATLSLNTLSDCADWSKTVEPALSQFYALPSVLLQILQRQPNAPSLTQLYTTTDPFISGLAISILFGAIFLVVAEVNKNYSQVDRCWSLLPTFYVGHFDLWARLNGVPSARIDLILAASCLWSARLTYNYWRKGGYEIGSEDYRWEIIRKNTPVWAFKILNITFISFMQSVLLYGLAVPVYPVLLAIKFKPDVQLADIAVAAMIVGLVVTEYIADGQQWDFHGAKAAYKKTAKPDASLGYTQEQLDRGFNTSGLWAYSRHPNFAAEQTIWFVLYQWSCYSTVTLFNWTFAGPTFLIMLFQGSTWLTELITGGKYPEYANYQNEVGMFAPKSFKPYAGFKGGKMPEPAIPKIIRTSDLAKKLKATGGKAQ